MAFRIIGEKILLQILVAAGLLAGLTPALARAFGGYECTVDCSGHKAGYDWAETGGNVTEADCEAILLRWPNRNSFYEGCLAYVEDPSRGSDQDDDGDDID
jgi:hypothetical protein